MTHWFSLTLLYFSRRYSTIVGALFPTMQTCFFCTNAFIYNHFWFLSIYWRVLRRPWKRLVWTTSSTAWTPISRVVMATRRHVTWRHRSTSSCTVDRRRRWTVRCILTCTLCRITCHRKLTSSPRPGQHGFFYHESRNVRVSKKILVLENLVSWRARNSRSHKAKLCCPN